MTGTARRQLHIGAQPNDGTGDPLRNAMDTINQNFIDLYEGNAVNSIGQPVISQGVTFTALNSTLLDYQLRTDLSTNVSHLTANNAAYLGGIAFTSYQTTAGLNANVAAYLNGVISGTQNINVAGASFHSDVYLDANLHIGGTLHITGETTIANATIITTNDKNLTLAYNATNAPSSNGSGLVVGGNFANFIYNDAKSAWQSSVDLVPYTDATQKLGNASNRWDVYADSINATSIVVTSNVGIGDTLYSGDKYGNSTSGSIGGAVVNSNYIAIGNSSVNSAVNSSAISIKSSLNGITANSSSVSLGNTTVNSFVSSNSFSLAYGSGYFTIDASMNVSSTGNFNLVNKTLYVDSGTTVGYQDSTAGSLGGVAISNSVIGVGNAANFTSIDRTGLSVNTYGGATASSLGGLKANVSGVYVGNAIANSYMNQTQVFIGNSTTNTVITANSITVNNVLIGNSTVYTNLTKSILDGLSSGILTVANSTAVSTGTGINTSTGGAIINSTSIGVGNTTVNSVITSNTLVTGNSTVNTYISSILISIGNGTYSTAINSTAVNTSSIIIGTFGASSSTTITFNGSMNTVVYVSDNHITLPSNPFNAGDRVQYVTATGSTVVGGLVNNSVYYIKTSSGYDITLSSTLGGSTIVLSLGTGSGHSLILDNNGFKANTMGLYRGNSTVNSALSQGTLTINYNSYYGDATAAAIGGLSVNGTLLGIGNATNKSTITSTNIVTAYINASAHTLGTSANLNTSGLTHVGYVNTTSDGGGIFSSNSLGIQSSINTSGVWTTGQINAASFTMGSGPIMKSNTTALYYIADGGLQLSSVIGTTYGSTGGGLKANSTFFGIGNTTANISVNTSTANVALVIGDYKGTATGSPGGIAINATAISIGNAITNYSLTSAGLSLPTASSTVAGVIKLGNGLRGYGTGGVIAGVGVSQYITSGSATIDITTNIVIVNFNGTCTLTLPSVSSDGHTIWIYGRIVSQSINSATSNIIPRTNGASLTTGSAIMTTPAVGTSSMIVWINSLNAWMQIGGTA
jgi:hypothetical protein